MKNIILTSAIICFAFTQLKAQKKSIEIGFRGGPGVSNYLVTSNSFRNTFAVGASIEMNFNNVFSVALQPSYETKGHKNETQFRDEFGNYAGTGTSENILNYYNIPILARFSFGNKARFVVSVGPYIGYLLNSKVKSDSPYGNDVRSGSYQTGVETGVSNAYGFEVPLTEQLIFEFDLRANFAMSTFTDNSGNSSYNYTSSTSGISVSFLALLGLNYRIPIGN